RAVLVVDDLGDVGQHFEVERRGVSIEPGGATLLDAVTVAGQLPLREHAGWLWLGPLGDCCRLCKEDVPLSPHAPPVEKKCRTIAPLTKLKCNGWQGHFPGQPRTSRSRASICGWPSDDLPKPGRAPALTASSWAPSRLLTSITGTLALGGSWVSCRIKT